jgi:hypothetical protein
MTRLLQLIQPLIVCVVQFHAGTADLRARYVQALGTADRRARVLSRAPINCVQPDHVGWYLTFHVSSYQVEPLTIIDDPADWKAKVGLRAQDQMCPVTGWAICPQHCMLPLKALSVILMTACNVKWQSATSTTFMSVP